MRALLQLVFAKTNFKLISFSFLLQVFMEKFVETYPLCWGTTIYRRSIHPIVIAFKSKLSYTNVILVQY